MSGAASRIRTRDPLITNQVLYRLSYSGTQLQNKSPNGTSKPVQTRADFCDAQPITRRLLYH
jgi:hypothetical protein